MIGEVSDGARLATAVDSATAPRHRWLPIKEGFSPDLVGMLQKHVVGRDNPVIVDPFSGSGTVAVAAAQLGWTACGVEVNPFLAFVGRAKLARIRSRTVRRYRDQVLEAVNGSQHSRLEGFSTFSKLFNQGVLEGFEGGWAAAELLPPQARRLHQLALLRASLEVCNASRDGKCLRYRSWRLKKNFGREDLVLAYQTALDEICEDLETHGATLKGRAEVRDGDSRRSAVLAAMPQFDACITSPPYLNSFDYTDVYRPELFLGKFVEDMAALRRLRLRTVRSHVQASWERPYARNFGTHFGECFSLIEERVGELWDKRIPLMIRAYFEDMLRILRGLRERARANAHLWIVVSTSAYAGVEVPVDLILSDLGERAGWRLQELVVLRRLRSSGQHWKKGTTRPPLRESLIAFQAAD